jgi:hypothetical protein
VLRVGAVSDENGVSHSNDPSRSVPIPSLQRADSTTEFRNRRGSAMPSKASVTTIFDLDDMAISEIIATAPKVSQKKKKKGIN